MSAKAIREFYGKQLIAKWLPEYSNGKHTIERKQVLVTPDVLEPSKGVSFETIAQANPWVLTDKLVVKPDQLIKRRGKAGLLAVNKTWQEVQAWILERMQREVQVEHVKGVLNHFIVEEFVPHKQEEEYYFCIVVRGWFRWGRGWVGGWMDWVVSDLHCLALNLSLPARRPRLKAPALLAHPLPVCFETPPRQSHTVQPRRRGDPLHARGRRGRR